MKFAAAAFLTIAAVTSCSGPCLAAPLSVPKEKPILEIVGQISAMNKDKAAVFDREMLEGLGVETVTTTTPWHTGPQKFEGVRLSKLMEVVGAKGKTLKALALNDYVTQIPLTDFADHSPILALKRDGEYMPVRDKGPLFIVYPYDSKPELKSQTYYGRSAWQLKRLEVID